jgi:hypothetical protein
MKVNLMFFSLLDEVLVTESTLVHRHPMMGKSHWIMSRWHENILLVNDAEFGRNLDQLVSYSKPVPSEKQELCTKRAKYLLRDSVYVPSKRKTHTFFFT